MKDWLQLLGLICFVLLVLVLFQQPRKPPKFPEDFDF